MEFSGNAKLKDIALSHPAARQVLEDAGLDYCCGGARSLHDACVQTNTATEEILNRLREAARTAAPCDANWLAMPLRELTRHICDRHHRYVREALSHTQALLDKVSAKHGEKHPELVRIGVAFTELGKEMIGHMQKEESILFPYIESLEAAAGLNQTVEPPFFRTVRNPIRAMMEEHDAASQLINQIRALTGNYTAPSDACTSFKALYQSLNEFESDLHRHVHLENNLLFPRAIQIEASFV